MGRPVIAEPLVAPPKRNHPAVGRNPLPIYMSRRDLSPHSATGLVYRRLVGRSRSRAARCSRSAMTA